ncbi:glucose-1-phosphate thymidylyltransferase, partial [Alsobacter soli]
IAYLNGFIGREQLLKSARQFGKTAYGRNLSRLAERSGSGN